MEPTEPFASSLPVELTSLTWTGPVNRSERAANRREYSASLARFIPQYPRFSKRNDPPILIRRLRRFMGFKGRVESIAASLLPSGWLVKVQYSGWSASSKERLRTSSG